jgi:mannitol/fructose-specific phosphotransferase system IIA component (Ntr-type)
MVNIWYAVKDFMFGEKREKVTPVKTLGDRGVKLSQFLSQAAIVVKKGEVPKEEAIEMLTKNLCNIYKIDDAAGVLNKIMEREKLESTFLDNEVAIPHARYEGVKEIKAVLGVFPGGVREDQSGKTPAQFIFLFLSPIDAFTQHLQLLTRIAFVFQDAKLKGRLLSCGEPEAIDRMLKEKEGVV